MKLNSGKVYGIKATLSMKGRRLRNVRNSYFRKKKDNLREERTMSFRRSEAGGRPSERDYVHGIIPLYSGDDSGTDSNTEF
jgi:hypothetical protein